MVFLREGGEASGHCRTPPPTLARREADQTQALLRRGERSILPVAQQVLDTALAWSVVNRHFDVADFLLEHGADINTNWSSHEPASILHDLVFQGNYESMRFLIDRGIDMTTRDYRWNATAESWARYAAKDEQMADFLAAAEREQSRQ